MKGKWLTPFDSELTNVETFHNADGTSSIVDMMCQEFCDCRYEDTDSCQVACLPYRGTDCCMYIVLPHEDTDIDTVMSEAGWAGLELPECSGELHLPKFKFDSILSFKEVLSKLGLGDMFDKDDSFPEMASFPAHISEIKQQCAIEVEEEGTEAAAVTFAVCEAGCPPPDDNDDSYFVMYTDRPFGFVIKNGCGQILFMGIVKNMTDVHEV